MAFRNGRSAARTAAIGNCAVVLDSATDPTATGIAEGLIVVQRTIADAEGSAALVQDAAPHGSQTVSDGQPGEGHAGAAAHVKDPAGVVTADGQVLSPQPLDVQALADGQLAARQRDGLIFQAVSEDNRVAAARGGDGGPQRPWPAVGRTRDESATNYWFQSPSPLDPSGCSSFLTIRV